MKYYGKIDDEKDLVTQEWTKSHAVVPSGNKASGNVPIWNGTTWTAGDLTAGNGITTAASGTIGVQLSNASGNLLEFKQAPNAGLFLEVNWSDIPDRPVAATTSTDGLLSSTDKAKIDNDINKAQQDYTITNGSYPVLFSGLAGIDSTSTRGAQTTNLTNSIYINPSTGDLHTTKINGVDVGASPAFTDTHYASSQIVGTSSTATANAETTNSNTFLNHIENNVVKSSHQITGSGTVSISADANGIITITGTGGGDVANVYVNGKSVLDDNKIAQLSVNDSLTSSDTKVPLSANQGRVLNGSISDLSTRVGNLEARGRYLSTWDATTGLPQTAAPVSPYQYKSGDYYIVGVVAAEGGTNYKPSGSSYTSGVASTEVETGTLTLNSVYLFDGTTWSLSSGEVVKYDDALSPTSANAVQNKVVYNALQNLSVCPFVVANAAPSNTNLLWIDTSESGYYKLRFYDTTSTSWKYINGVWT